MLGLPKVPALFGCVIMLKEPFMIPSALIYNLLVYLLPVFLVIRFGSEKSNALAGKLLRLPELADRHCSICC